jgi:2-amino-4-hydroxy-6-hydroxymethyldihydropteridine diphosphokinase
MSQHIVVLLLGSNLGDKKKNITDALEMIDSNVGKAIVKSQFLETNPIDFVSCNNFINFAIELKTNYSPIEVLRRVKSIELKLGRTLDSKALGGYQDRIIDIDIVSYDDLKFVSNQLILPHHGHLVRSFSIELINELNKKKHKV